MRRAHAQRQRDAERILRAAVAAHVEGQGEPQLSRLSRHMAGERAISHVFGTWTCPNGESSWKGSWSM